MAVRKHRIRMLQLLFLPVVFAILFIRPNWGLESTAAYLVELTGYVFLLAGLGVRIWAILYIGGRKSREVISDGPYSVCRNPLYVGTTLVAIGVGLCFENLIVLIAAPAILLPVHYLTARLEEAHLCAKFPGTYAAYMERTPRFLPRPSLYHSAPTIEVSTRAIRRVLIDTTAVLLIPEIEDLLELLHESGLLPVLWHFP